MDNQYFSEIKALTTGPKHHLFGFHDLCAWNRNNDRLVALEVDNILTPPDPTIAYGLGYVNSNSQYIQFGSTHAFNYPQGARQQWIGDSNKVIVNDIHSKSVISKIYDTDTAYQLDLLADSTHVIANDGWAFGLDYARLFRLGAYGYAGVEDSTVGVNAPSTCGIVKHNIYTKERQILLSVSEIANFSMAEKAGKHHYITHLVLNPNQKRIAFLHRYKLSDGGETTRLCTIGVNGDNLRCLAVGFLSHFDWVDNDAVMIWGRKGSNVEKFRESLLYRLIPPKTLHLGKEVLKKILNRSGVEGLSPFHWLCISDQENPNNTFIGENLIREDGHPMFCPTNRDWFVCDNYPNKEGIRTLFLYNIKTNLRIDLGQFKMIDTQPDIELSKILLNVTDPELLKIIGLDKFAFTRSGLHCDLHPRWSPDGSKVAFDSIHEGTRQIYSCDVKKLIV